jgi:hypothetical protein
MKFNSILNHYFLLQFISYSLNPVIPLLLIDSKTAGIALSEPLTCVDGRAVSIYTFYKLPFLRDEILSTVTL